MSSRLGDAGFLSLPPALRADYLRHVRPLALRYFDDRVLAAFPALDRVRGHLLRHGGVGELEELARFQVHQARPEPLVEAGRTYARYPGLRAGTAVPDAYFDISDELALHHCRVHLGWDGGSVSVRWEPYAPALRAPDLRWALSLEPLAGGDRVVGRADAGTRQVTVGIAVADAQPLLADGTYRLVTAVRAGTRAARAAVGAAGTLGDDRASGVRLLGGRVATLRRAGRGRLLLDLGRCAERLPATATVVRWEPGGAARLRVEGVARVAGLDPGAGWAGRVVLRERTTGRKIETAADLATCPPGDVAFAAVLDLAAALRPGALDDGLWDVHLRLAGAGVHLTGRVGAPAIPLPARVHGARPFLPFATVRGNLSLDVGAAGRELLPRVELRSAHWTSPRALAVRLAARGEPAADGQPDAVVLVLREQSRREEVVLPLVRVGGQDASAPPELSGLVPLRLAPGSWQFELRARFGGALLQTCVRPGPDRVPAKPRRWLSRGGPLSATVRTRRDGVVVVVAQLSRRQLVEGLLRALRARQPTARRRSAAQPRRAEHQ